MTQGARNLGETEFMKLFEMSQTLAVGSATRNEILNALGKTLNTDLLNIFLSASITATGELLNEIELTLTASERVTIINSIISGRFDCVKIILDFIINHANAFVTL